MAKEIRTMYEEAYRANGVMGFYTKGIKDRDEAVKAIEHYIFNDSEDFLENWKDSNGEPFVFDPENVKAGSYHTHKACGVETINPDGYCCACGFDAVLNGNGRLTYTYFV